MPNVPGLRDQCRTGWPEDQPRPPRPVIVATDPISGLVRLTVPHDPAGNTCQGNTSQYCTTLEMTADRWCEVLQAIAEKGGFEAVPNDEAGTTPHPPPPCLVNTHERYVP